MVELSTPQALLMYVAYYNYRMPGAGGSDVALSTSKEHRNPATGMAIHSKETGSRRRSLQVIKMMGLA